MDITINEAIKVLEDEIRENAHKEGSWLEATHRKSIKALKRVLLLGEILEDQPNKSLI